MKTRTHVTAILALAAIGAPTTTITANAQLLPRPDSPIVIDPEDPRKVPPDVNEGPPLPMPIIPWPDPIADLIVVAPLPTYPEPLLGVLNGALQLRGVSATIAGFYDR
jgi:hypothetical protein